MSKAERAKIVEQAVPKTTNEQLEMVNKYGGVKVLKNYSGGK